MEPVVLVDGVPHLDWLHERGQLSRGVSVDDARDTIWAYNSAELYQLLVIERGWTPEHDGRWVAAALTAALL
jgi:hypothetical protein